MSEVLNRRKNWKPEETACQGQDSGRKKPYVDPQVAKEEVLPDITGDPTIDIGSPPGGGSILK